MTTAGGVPITLAVTLVLCGVLTGTSIGVPWLMSRRWRKPAGSGSWEDEEQTPYGPPPARAQEMRS